MNASRSRRIARLEDTAGRTNSALGAPPDIEIVFVSPGGARSAPMKFDESGTLVEVKSRKKRQAQPDRPN
jgi:hypothetical protein